MRISLFLSGLLVSACCHTPPLVKPPRGEGVVLLHGLLRSERSMRPMARHLQRQGFWVENIDYPSRTAKTEVLAATFIPPAVERLRERGATRIHFVGHSLGSIMSLWWLHTTPIPDAGHLVMLAPPNQGSEIVDHLRDWRVFRWINGPASLQLGTDPDGLPQLLSSATVPTAVFAGSCSINPILSLMIPGPDDGKVSLEGTVLQGSAEHRVFRTAHPFIMRNPGVLTATGEFLLRQ